jgi:hypothetical protein
MGTHWYGGLYPVPEWRAAHMAGYTAAFAVDVFAVLAAEARTEGFNPTAEGGVGHLRLHIVKRAVTDG